MHVLGPYCILSTKINNIPHYYAFGRWDTDKKSAYKFYDATHARHIADIWHIYTPIEIETCYYWLPPVTGSMYSSNFWNQNGNKPIDFDHAIKINGQNKIMVNQGAVQIVLPESELIRLFGWYFELEDHNSVLELVERVDR